MSPSITMYIIHVGIFYILILVILISARARVANHCHCHWIAIYIYASIFSQSFNRRNAR